MKHAGKTCDSLTEAANSESRVARLRERQSEIDGAVMHAYGRDDLDLGHGYHEPQNLAENDRVRFTISDVARSQILRRFAELSRQRHEEEQASAPTEKTRASKSLAKATPTGQGALALLDVPAPTNSKTKAAAPAKKASTRRTSR